MIHTLAVLQHGYLHIHCLRALIHYYDVHGALRFLRSGIPSTSPATQQQAVAELRYLAATHTSPLDW